MASQDVQYILGASVHDVDEAEIASVTMSDADPRSPPLSTYSGSTTHLNRFGSSGGTSVAGSGSAQCLSTALDRQQERATFDVGDWEWHYRDPFDIHQDTRPTPRQPIRTLMPTTLDLERISSQLRPIPTNVPQRLPSLLEYTGSTHGDTEDDEDEQSEADSIWFFFGNENGDPQVATSHSLVDLVTTNAEALEDFSDIAEIVASLQGRDDDGDIETTSL